MKNEFWLLDGKYINPAHIVWVEIEKDSAFIQMTKGLGFEYTGKDFEFIRDFFEGKKDKPKPEITGFESFSQESK